MKTIYVIAGGTMVHVSPHFALCAPAYGKVGAEIHRRLEAAMSDSVENGARRVLLINTRMAGGNAEETLALLKEVGMAEGPETNADVRELVLALIARPDTAAIVMAAAICDFEPVELAATDERGTNVVTAFGNSEKRLHHVSELTLTLRPGGKIIDLVKRERPDVVLVTFKTTAGVEEGEMVAQAQENLRRSGSDLVFANDVHSRQNVVVTPEGGRLRGKDRGATLDLLCQELVLRVRG